MCILVVDDNQDAANTLALLLEASGHTVFVEYTAKGALDCAHAEELDAVILDIGLPERDGWELCRQMKTIPHLANAAFIAVSGYKRETDVRMSKEVGFDAILQNLFNCQTFSARLPRSILYKGAMKPGIMKTFSFA